MTPSQWTPFQEYGLQQVMVDLFVNRREGRLACRSGEQYLGFFWHQGAILDAKGNQVDVLLVDLLIRRGLFTREQFGRLRRGFEPGRPLRENLLQSGVITGHELTSVESSLLLDALAAALRWRSGSYAWSETQTQASNSIDPLVLPLDFLRAMLRFEDRQWLGEQFGDLNQYARLLASADVELTQLDEWPTLAQVAPLLDGTRTLRQLVVASGTEEFSLLKCLYAWLLLGYLKLEAAPSLRETLPLPVQPDRDDADGFGSAVPARNEWVKQAANEREEPSFAGLAETMSLTRPAGSFDLGSVPLHTHEEPPLRQLADTLDNIDSARSRPRPTASAPPKPGRKWLWLTLALISLALAVWFLQPWRHLGWHAEGEPLSVNGAQSQFSEIPKPPSKQTFQQSSNQSSQTAPASSETLAPPTEVPSRSSVEAAGAANADISSSGLANGQTPPHQLWHQGRYQRATGLWETRLNTQPGGFTLGLFMACDLENIDDMVNRHGHSSMLFVVPRTYQGQACYWVCWGQFPDRAAAQRHIRALPADLMADKERVRAYPIAFMVR